MSRSFVGDGKAPATCTCRFSIRVAAIRNGACAGNHDDPWSGAESGFGPISASFSSYEEFATPWQMPQVRVEGGRLESLVIVPVNFV